MWSYVLKDWKERLKYEQIFEGYENKKKLAAKPMLFLDRNP